MNTRLLDYSFILYMTLVRRVFVINTLEKDEDREQLMQFIYLYLKDCSAGNLLLISEHTTSLSKYMREVNDPFLWEKFMSELVYSYEHGFLNYREHWQMIETAAFFDTLATTPYNCVTVEALPFLFLLMPVYVLTFHYPSFVENLVTRGEKDATFYSLVYPKYEDYSSWFMAGVHRYIRYAANLSNLFSCLNELSPQSPFLINLTPLDYKELYTIYKLNPQCIERLLLSSPSMLHIKCLHLIDGTASELQTVLSQCQQLQNDSVSLLKQILMIMNTCSNFVFITFVRYVEQPSGHSSDAAFPLSERICNDSRILCLPFPATLCTFSVWI